MQKTQSAPQGAVLNARQRAKAIRRREFKRDWPVYLLFLPAVVLFGIFNYAPMFGIVMAFENFKPTKGFFGSKWVGMANFMDLFSSEEFFQVFRNRVKTGQLSGLQLVDNQIDEKYVKMSFSYH